MEAVFGILFMASMVFCLMLVYKKRMAISKWLDDPDMLKSNGNRKKLLKRRIEDAEEQIAEIENREPNANG